MLYRLPDLVSNSESSDVEEVDETESPDYPHDVNSDVSSEDESDSGEPSPDDQDGAGEEEEPNIVVLCPSVTYTGCAGCGKQVATAVLGTPDAVSVLDTLIHGERLNPICLTCANQLDPLNLL